MMATKIKAAKGLEHEKRKGESVGVFYMYLKVFQSALNLF